MGIDTVPGCRILLDGVDVAVAAKRVLFIYPPACPKIGIEARIGISAAADFANPFVPDVHAETFLHPDFQAFGHNVVLIREIPRNRSQL